MEILFEDPKLERIYMDPTYTGRYPDHIVSLIRRRIQAIRMAPDERVLRAAKSLHLEKLKGERKHQHSLRLNKQWRLIIEFRKSESGKIVAIISVEDYH